jgi:hypothetical protein
VRGPSGKRPREVTLRGGVERGVALLDIDIEGGDLFGGGGGVSPAGELSTGNIGSLCALRVAATKSASRSLRTYTSVLFYVLCGAAPTSSHIPHPAPHAPGPTRRHTLHAVRRRHRRALPYVNVYVVLLPATSGTSSHGPTTHSHPRPTSTPHMVRRSVRVVRGDTRVVRLGGVRPATTGASPLSR